MSIQRIPELNGRSSRHILIYGDSSRIEYRACCKLVLTSPPYYHPTRLQSAHGVGFRGDLAGYIDFVSGVLVRCAGATPDQRVCFVKTDFWYKRRVYPIGFQIMNACVAKGLTLVAHWVWRKRSAYSPYGPNFANIFLFGHQIIPPGISGVIIEPEARRRRGIPGSYTPEIFGLLIELLTEPNDVILDPFAGIGSVIEAAAVHNRRAIGIEVSRKQLNHAARQLRKIPDFAIIGGAEC